MEVYNACALEYFTLIKHYNFNTPCITCIGGGFVLDNDFKNAE